MNQKFQFRIGSNGASWELKAVQTVSQTLKRITAHVAMIIPLSLTREAWNVRVMGQPMLSHGIQVQSANNWAFSRATRIVPAWTVVEHNHRPGMRLRKQWKRTLSRTQPHKQQKTSRTNDVANISAISDSRRNHAFVPRRPNCMHKPSSSFARTTVYFRTIDGKACRDFDLINNSGVITSWFLLIPLLHISSFFGGFITIPAADFDNTRTNLPKK
jgi:hypothetical protein